MEQTKSQSLTVKLLAAAPTSSMDDLVKAFPMWTRSYIGQKLSLNRVRIGMRANMRSGLKHTHAPLNQIQIYAALYHHPNRPNYVSGDFQAIALKKGVTREMVSQIACKAKELGLL